MKLRAISFLKSIFCALLICIAVVSTRQSLFAQPAAAPPDTQSPSMQPPSLPTVNLPNFIKPHVDPLTHVLAPGDVVEFTINILKDMPKTTAELPKLFQIRADGDVELPVVGETKAGGLTLAQLSKVIDSKLRLKLRDPRFRLGISTAAPVQVVVLGEVVRPGRYDIAPGSGVQEALAVAGGLSQLADKNSILIVDGVTRKTVAALKPSDPGYNLMTLKNGDAVYVLPGRKVNVVGEVFKPGTFALPNESGSPIDAMNVAGGPKPNASLPRCVIYRPGKSLAINVDLSHGQIAILSVSTTTNSTDSAGNATMLQTNPVYNDSSAPRALNVTTTNSTHNSSQTPIDPSVAVMQEGDVLIVPPRQAVVITGAPKLVSLVGGETLLDIVLQAGVSNDAHLDDIKILRVDANTNNATNFEPEHVNLRRYFENQDRSVLVPIKDGDIVVIDLPQPGLVPDFRSIVRSTTSMLLNPLSLFFMLR